MSQDPSTTRPTFVRTAIVLGAAVLAALGGGYALAANTPHQVVSPPAAPSEFVGITPVRVLDTRGPNNGPIGVPAAAKLGAGQSIDVAVGGVGAIPKDATSVAVNITIDEDATLKSFLTVWPTGQARPFTSANNAEPGLVAANSAIFQLGTDGKLSVFNQQGTVNVIMDVTGYFVASGTTGTTTTTTAGGTTTTTTVAGATLTTDQPAYTPPAVATLSGTGWTGCTAPIEVFLDAAVAPVNNATIAPDGTLSDTVALTTTNAPPGSHTLRAQSTPATPACTATATFTVPQPAP